MDPLRDVRLGLLRHIGDRPGDIRLGKNARQQGADKPRRDIRVVMLGDL